LSPAEVCRAVQEDLEAAHMSSADGDRCLFSESNDGGPKLDTHRPFRSIGGPRGSKPA